MKQGTIIVNVKPRVLMTADELKGLGLDQVGYIKPYMMKGDLAWVLHAADGTAIAVQDTPDAALHSARAQDLSLATLH